MPEGKLTPEEAEVLRAAVSTFVVKNRSGELGIMHGADRFVSTQRIFRKKEREMLDAAARKLGLGGISEYRG
ncbi:MAG TPA: hypothetical protein VFR81_07180 [Longimicrobium sp.]|nr:hypothetical protein [Longimicrobium sp.]